MKTVTKYLSVSLISPQMATPTSSFDDWADIDPSPVLRFCASLSPILPHTAQPTDDSELVMPCSALVCCQRGNFSNAQRRRCSLGVSLPWKCWRSSRKCCAFISFYFWCLGFWTWAFDSGALFRL